MDPLPFPGSVNSSGPEPEPAPENGQQFPKTRTSAKEAVSSRWASRAAEKSTNAKQPQVGRVRQKQKQPQQILIQPTQLPGPPINRICQTWKQVQRVIGSNLLRHLALEQKHYKPKSKSVASASVSVASIKKKTKAPQLMCEFELQRHRQANKDQLANTLTNIRVSTALQNQLAEITNGQSKHYLKSVVSILPAGFDESSALTSTIQNRKRAFLLMDLGNVIRAHAEFITYTCGFGDMLATVGGGGLRLPPTHELLRKRGNVNVNNVGRKRKGVYIQPQFKVMKNPSSELLKLLTRLGVDLRCNSSDDVLAASKAIGEERTERMRGYMTPLHKDNLNANTSTNNNANEQLHSQPQPDIKTMSLVDDVSKSRKPNGYFRRLLQAQSMHIPTSSTSHVHVAVDGVDEVHRISSTIEQLAKRNRSTMKIKMEGFRIILRLPVVETEGNVYSEKNMDNGAWERLVLAVHAAASEENCELAGVSVNLRPWSDSLSTKTGEESERILNNICTHLRIFRLLMLSVGQYHIRIDLTELPYPFNRENSEKLTASLKNMICSNVSEEELMQLRVHLPDEDPAETSVDDREVNNNDKRKQMNTAYEYIAQLANDPCTSSLVFTADVSDQLVARAGALCTRIIGVKIGKSLKQTNTNESHDNQDEDDRGVISKHYYIDDGCYGSLGSSTTCGSEIGSSNCEKVLATGTTTAKATAVKGHVPIALYGGKFTPKPTHLTLQAPRKKLNCDALPTTNKSRLVNCTVWGPTCDGLDKVCNNIKLPEDLQANRDWLVFSNLGCGGFGGGLGLGTAFNGFDPPDVSYCVLGYFAHVK